ncbi:hypothetical protein [Paraburkholderia nemoris]|nr:hypothetical protein [Paraburkholderia nemoris]
MNEAKANKCTGVRLHAATVIEDERRRTIIVCANMLDVAQTNGAYG